MEANVSHDGHMYSFYSSGMASFTASVFIGNLKIFEFSYLISPLSIFFVFASLIFYIATHYFSSTTSPTFYVYRTFKSHWNNINFYVPFIITIAISMFIDVAINRY